MTDTPTDAPHPSSSQALARSAQAGCSAAFGELVLRFQAPLQHYLRLRTRGAADAEEIAQAAFVRAWEQLPRYDARWHFSTWLYAIARAEAASFHRRAERRAVAEARHAPVELVPEPWELHGADTGRGQLWELASRLLSVQQFDALWLRYAEDLPPRQIGHALGRPAAAVRVLLFRARRTLERHLRQVEAARAQRHAPWAREPHIARGT